MATSVRYQNEPAPTNARKLRRRDCRRCGGVGLGVDCKFPVHGFVWGGTGCRLRVRSDSPTRCSAAARSNKFVVRFPASVLTALVPSGYYSYAMANQCPCSKLGFQSTQRHEQIDWNDLRAFGSHHAAPLPRPVVARHSRAGDTARFVLKLRPASCREPGRGSMACTYLHVRCLFVRTYS